MFAVVTASCADPNGRKITETVRGYACHIEVGRKVSRKALRRILKKFNGDVIFGTSADTRGIRPFDTGRFKERLLFGQFVRYALSQEGVGLHIGLCDPGGEYLLSRRLTSVIAHAESTVICTDRTADNHCRRWLLETGICPEVIADRADLKTCDCVFAPEGLRSYGGVLFGRGGKGLDRDSLPVPPLYLPLVRAGADPAEVLCMIERERTAELARQK